MTRMVIRLLLMATVLMVATNFALADKKVETGVLTKTTFTDTAFGYTTTLPAHWKAKIMAEPGRVRLILTRSQSQWAPLAPKTYVSRPYAPIMRSRETVEVRPKVMVLAERTALSTEEFLGYLFGDDGWQQSTTEYLMGLERGTLEEEINQPFPFVAGEPALQVTALKLTKGSLLDQYSVEFSANTTVPHVMVTAFRHGARAFVIALFSAQGLVRSNYREITHVLSDWKFLGEEKPDTTHRSN